MENYTKYRLKAADELEKILTGLDKLFVIACNKCFKEFETDVEPDCQAFVDLAEGMGKTITGVARADFLCNKTKALKALPGMVPEGTENVVVVSCGLGIQTVADVLKLPVVAACDSLN